MPPMPAKLRADASKCKQKQANASKGKQMQQM
jgi:hypothetical protein